MKTQEGPVFISEMLEWVCKLWAGLYKHDNSN